jgi:hypothetical protein
MESRKKAKKLFDKYYLLLTYFSENSSIDSRRIYAKRLAIIAVNEILDNFGGASKKHSCSYSTFGFYADVKREIEKL